MADSDLCQAVCFGKPCIKGHRIWISLMLDFLATGSTIPELPNDYPGLEEADIRACIARIFRRCPRAYVAIPLESSG